MGERLKQIIDEAALLVIDIQNDYCHNNGVLGKRGADLSHIQQAVSNLIPLLDEARQAKVRTILMRTIHDAWTNSPAWKKRQQGKGLEICKTGSWGAEFYQISPQPEERVITKHRYSAFIDTDLELILRSLEVKGLLVCGVATNVCVESTARDAYMKDYQLALIEDCIATTSLEEHKMTLHNLETYFDAVITSSTEVIKLWKEL